MLTEEASSLRSPSVLLHCIEQESGDTLISTRGERTICASIMSTIDTAATSFYDRMFQISTINAVVGIVVLYGVYRLLRIGTRDPRMPPGPPTLPIIGNLHQIPTTQLYKKFVALSPDEAEVCLTVACVLL